jgi:RND superfamily putative drug exporter
MEVILDVGPYTNEAMDALRDLPGVIAAAADGTPLADPAVHALGATAIMADIRTVTGEDLVRVALLVAAALLVILLILLRDFPLSVILILATAAGYFATLGLAALVGHHVFGLTGLDWKVEFFLFCILVAVGQDYNILIVSRILEESADPALTGRAGPALAARRAIMRTGGIISCCGVVMAVTFGSMMAAPLLVMRQIGFALAAGVLIDTFVIRPLLVPAAYVLLERARRRPAPTRTA